MTFKVGDTVVLNRAGRAYRPATYHDRAGTVTKVLSDYLEVKLQKPFLNRGGKGVKVSDVCWFHGWCDLLSPEEEFFGDS